MNGMIAPSVSAGSSHRAARDTCTPHVMTPSGAAWSGRAGARRRHASATSAARLREGKSVEPSRGLANDMRPLQRSPGSFTCESAEISLGSVMIHLQISDAGTGGVRAGTHANGLQSTGPVHRLESVAELTCMVWIGQHWFDQRAPAPRS